MFNSIVPQTVEQSFLRAKWQNEEDRQADAQNRLDLYSDNYADIIEEALSEQFCKENYERLRFFINHSQNIFKRVVNQISMVYKAEAQRTLSVESDRYEEIKDDIDIDSRLRKVNRLTNALNEVIVVVAVRDGRLCYDLVTPNVCGVVQNEKDPTKMDALCYQTTSVNTASSSDINYAYWSVAGEHAILDKDFKVVELIYSPTGDDATLGAYPYKDADGRFVIPAVVSHREHPEDKFWDQDAGADLYNAAVALGVKMTLMDYYFKSASFKQPYVIGPNIDIPMNQIMDPTSWIKVNAPDPNSTAEVGLLDLQIAIDKLIEAITFQINSVINNYGISADMWTMSISEMSGRALKIRNMALLELRQEQVPMYRRFEMDLFAITRIVNNAHAKFMKWAVIPEDADFTVDFGEIEFPEDPVYEIDLEKKRLDLGLISPGKFYQRFNADITDEAEAEKLWMKNIKALAELKDANPDLDAALSGIIKAAGQGGGFGQDGEQTGGAA
jgi:hypothetical protein